MADARAPRVVFTVAVLCMVVVVFFTFGFSSRDYYGLNIRGYWRTMEDTDLTHQEDASFSTVSPSTASKVYSTQLQTRTLYQSGFTFHNPELICPDKGKGFKIFIMVLSAPKEAEKRTAIRMTWGHYGHRLDVGLAFLVGRSNDSSDSDELMNEAAIYGDIIHENNTDSYDKLTIKVLSMLEWTKTYCFEVPFLFKVDDDLFVNVENVLHLVEKHRNASRQIFGRLAQRWGPNRNPASKWHLSTETYKPDLFPDFVTGASYIITQNAIRDLYETALRLPFIHLEDVFITGIVAERIGIKRVAVDEMSILKGTKRTICDIKRYINFHKASLPEMIDLWQKALDVKTKC